VYVFDRLVLPALSREQIDDAANGRLSPDGLTRQLIRGSLSYRFVRLTPEVVRSGGSRVGSQ
jgi:hypothetical protein